MTKIKSLLSYLIMAPLLVLAFVGNDSSNQSREKNDFSSYYSDMPKSEFASDSNFFYANSRDKNTLQPVVKLIFQTKYFGAMRPVSSATGFSIEYNKKKDVSYIITNDHFCTHGVDDDNGEFIFQRSNTPMSDRWLYVSGKAKIVYTDPTKDLCMLEAEGRIKPAKVAGKYYRVRQMEEVSTIGAPAGVFPVKIDTYVGSLQKRDVLPSDMWSGGDLLVLSEEGFGGQSGSPVYNKSGDVIGVVFMNYSNRSGTVYGTFAIPLSDLRYFISVAEELKD